MDLEARLDRAVRDGDRIDREKAGQPKERPILFKAEMVRALLAGTKTQTRRLLKPQPFDHAGATWQTRDGGVSFAPCRDELCRGVLDQIGPEIRCPYGVAGDRLWVRETFEHIAHGPEFGVRVRYADGAEQAWLEPPHPSVRQNQWRPLEWRKRPGIHMPRWASRITLEVTEVRVQRLQDISGEDAKAEGIACPRCSCDVCARSSAMCPADADTHALEFGLLWDKINGEGSWAASPWVWAVSFRRVQP